MLAGNESFNGNVPFTQWKKAHLSGGGREAGRKTGRQAAGRPQALHTHRPQPPFTYTHAHMLRVLHYVTKNNNNNNLKGEMTLGMSLCYHVVNSLN